MEETVILGNVQVGSHGDIQGKVKDTGGRESASYTEMLEEMNEHYNNDQMVTMVPYHAQENEVCAGKHGTTWYRVRVQVVLSRRSGHDASCLLMDEGSRVMIPVSGLRHLPNKFLQLPFQVKRILLHGIQPLSMMINEEDFSVSQRSVKLWDESAVKLIKDSIDEAVQIKCVVMQHHCTSSLSVRMYLQRRNGGFICLNEVLVKLNYAAVITQKKDDLSMPAQKPRKTIEEVFRARKLKLSQEPGSDVDITAKSDTEYTCRTRDEKDTCRVNISDRGYMTDSQGVSAISHRSIHKSHITKPLVLDRSNPSNNIDSRQSQRMAVKESVNSSQNNSVYEYSTQQKNSHKNTMLHSESFLQTSPTEKTSFTSPSSKSSLLDKNSSRVQKQISPGYGRGSLVARPDTSPQMLVVSPTVGLSSSITSDDSPTLNTSSPCKMVGRGALLNSSVLSKSVSPKTSVGFHGYSDSEYQRPGRKLSLIDRVMAVSDKSAGSESDSLEYPSHVHSNSAIHKPDFKNSLVSKLDLPSIKSQTHSQSQDISRRRLKLNSDEELDTYINRRSCQPVMSGNESSASGMSVVAASVTGQNSFKKSRLPKDSTLRKSMESVDLSHRQSDSVISRTSPMKLSLDTMLNKRRDTEAYAGSVRFDLPDTSFTDYKRLEMIGKFTGQKLLEKLAPNVGKSQTSSKRKTQTRLEDSGMFGSSDKILVHGGKPRKPFYNIGDAHFADYIVQAWENENFASPSLVQAYTWPTIVQGRHVVTLSPRNTGKTLAYLYPLISSISEPENYKDISTGMGPYVIILALSWKRAKNIYIKAHEIIGRRQGMRLVLLHGGGQEENKACTLINGCEILVVTPPCLKRVLEARFTDLRRLCHLVIDNADISLKTFTADIRDLMKQYNEVIKKEMKHSGCPRQILLFGSEWNTAVEEFMRNCLNEPILIMTSAFEACIYGKVRQVTHMCHNNEKMKEVIGIMGNISGISERIIIFSTCKADIIKLHQALKNYSHYCMMVHQDMDLYEVQQVADEWNHNLSLLICCDEFITEMHITNATSLIHFDLPNSKTKMSNRLGCLRQYFYNFSRKDKKIPVVPISHLLISPDCLQQVKPIYQLLKRSKSAIPTQLKDFMAGIMHVRDNDDEKELCSQLLAYGSCRDKWQCKYRHSLLPEVDVIHQSDWLPDEGEVKVLVTHVDDASHYFVRLLRVRHHNREVEDMSPTYSCLQMELGLWYSNLTNQKRHTAPFVGELCGFQDNEMFYRIQILDLEMNNPQKGIIEVLVKFVDSGRVAEIPMSRLYELPEKLKLIPFQAIEVYVCKVRPIDKDIDWTYKASTYISELLDGKTLDGKIVLRLGHIMWLDPLVMRLHLGETQAIINKFYVNKELVHNGLASENPDHLKKLYELCKHYKDKVNIPRVLLVKTKMSQILQTDVLPCVKHYHDVCVSAVSSPDIFFVQRKEKQSELEDLMTEINEYIEALEEEETEQELSVGKFCLAQYTTFDNRWYRGQILKVENEACEIFFADYGDRDIVPNDKIREIPNERFFELPLQAIECKLGNINPHGDAWDESAGNVLWDLTHYVNGDLKHLVAHVTSKVASEYAGHNRFVVDVYNTSGQEDSNLAEELTWRQLAVPDDECTIKHLFQRPVHVRMKRYSSLLDKIPDICATLYWEQEPGKAMDFTEEILSILHRSLKSLTTEAETSVVKALGCLAVLIGRVRWGNVHSVILECLLCLTQVNDRFAEVLLKENCVPNVVRCLEMTSDTIVQHQAADFICKLSNTSSRMKTSFQASEHLSVMYELLESTQCEQVQGSVCRAFISLCSGTESVYQYLMKMSICQKLVKCLNQSLDHHVTEAIILLISTLATHDSGHADLKRESLVESVVKNLSKTECNKCIQHSVQLCDNFAATRRKHKTFLLEVEMVPILRRLLQLNLQSTTKQLCKDLLSSLVVTVPSEPLVGTSFRPDTDVHTFSHSGVPPPVYWSQNTFRVMLSVKVTEAPTSKDIVSFHEDTVKFRASMKGVCYAFKYTLFDRVIPAKCNVSVRAHEVLISMKKENEGKWPRLLHDKLKPANLSVDYERFVDSSSDSEVYDEDLPFILKKKKKVSKPFSSPGKQKRKITSDMPNASEDESTETDDSLENMVDPDDRDDAYDMFEIS